LFGAGYVTGRQVRDRVKQAPRFSRLFTEMATTDEGWKTIWLVQYSGVRH
jgi:hypothetical protein